MGTYSKGLDLYKAQKARFDALGVDRRTGHKQLAEAGLADSQELTSGDLTPSQTRGAFARQAQTDEEKKQGILGARRNLTKRQLKNRGLGAIGVPLLPINKQSHKLHDSFRLVRKRASGGSQQFDLTQEDPGGGIYRLLPGGTRKMVDSGYSREVRRRWQARNKAFLDHYRAKQAKP